MVLFDIHTHSHNSIYKSIVNINPVDFSNYDIESNYFSCGIHPWYSIDGERSIDLLNSIVKYSSVVAIGESGLDKLRGASMPIQINLLEQQVEISESICKPMIIHCVRAWDVLLSIHKRLNPKQSWIIHGFRGKPALANQLLESGMYISIGEKYNMDTVKYIPLNRLFCETDESKISIEEVYRHIANDKKVTLSQLSVQIKQNVENVFGLKS